MAEVYVPYEIFFKDPAEYAFALGIAGSATDIIMSPRDAATAFGIPFPYPTGPIADIPKGIFFFPDWSPGKVLGTPESSGAPILLDDSVLSVTVAAAGGEPGSSWPASSAEPETYTWSGRLVKAGGETNTTAPEPSPTAIPQRRWSIGFENLPGMEGVITKQDTLSTTASRTVGGRGFAFRGGSTSGPQECRVATFRSGLAPAASWERFYFRIKKTPTAVTAENTRRIWGCRSAASAFNGAALVVENTTGELGLYSVSAAAVYALKDTISGLNENQWYRCDIFVKYQLNDGIIKVYIDGTLAAEFTEATNNNLGTSSTHFGSFLGPTTTAVSDIEVDLDDWINADLPGNLDSSTLTFIDTDYPIDWLMGSHVYTHYVTQITAPDFTGPGYGILNQGRNPIGASAIADYLTTTVSAATIEALTDAPALGTQIDIGLSFGAVAAYAGIYSQNISGSDGQLGLKIAGGAATLGLTGEANVFNDTISPEAYLPTGMLVPVEIAPLSLAYTKAADASIERIAAMAVTVEHIGVWGTEDDSNTSEYNRDFKHNYRYPNSAWAYYGPVIEAPCYAVGGTITGDGSTQLIALPAPCHFFFIRNLNTGVCSFSFGAGEVAGDNIDFQGRPQIRIFTDSLGAVYVELKGDTAAFNDNGVDYQYIAFCDPGMRFNVCSAYKYSANGATPRAYSLLDPSFTPEAAFVQGQLMDQNSAIAGTRYKGPGNGTSEGLTIGSSGTLANFGTFAAGVFGIDSDIIDASTNANNFSLWRTVETGSCLGTMVQLTSYTGDGSSPRTIPLTPTSGRFPLLVLVIGSNGNAYYRDPSHTGSNSNNIATGANSASAITGVGVDEITIDATLNALGVHYEVFVICGSDVGMVNGEFYKYDCQPAEGTRPTPAEPSGDVITIGDGGLILGGAPATTLLQDISGIYTLVPGKRNDTLIDRQTGQDSVDVAIPDPTFGTGYIGG